MDDDDDDGLNTPIFTSFRPFVWFLYFGSFVHSLLAVVAFLSLTAFGPHSRPDLVVTLWDRVFWSIGCFGLARVVRWVVLADDRAAQPPVKPPTETPKGTPESD